MTAAIEQSSTAGVAVLPKWMLASGFCNSACNPSPSRNAYTCRTSPPLSCTAQLLASVEEHQKQRQGLSSLLESVQQAKLLVDGQLKRSQGVAEQLASDKQALSQMATRLQSDCDALLQTVDKMATEKRGLETQARKRRAWGSGGQALASTTCCGGGLLSMAWRAV